MVIFILYDCVLMRPPWNEIQLVCTKLIAQLSDPAQKKRIRFGILWINVLSIIDQSTQECRIMDFASIKFGSWSVFILSFSKACY